MLPHDHYLFEGCAGDKAPETLHGGVGQDLVDLRASLAQHQIGQAYRLKDAKEQGCGDDPGGQLPHQGKDGSCRGHQDGLEVSVSGCVNELTWGVSMISKNLRKSRKAPGAVRSTRKAYPRPVIT